MVENGHCARGLLVDPAVRPSIRPLAVALILPLTPIDLSQINILILSLIPPPFRSLCNNQLGPEVGKMIAEVLKDPKCKIQTIE